MEWLIFVYALPSQPSRKRAYIWRELKKLGAVYLRDGVAALPGRPDLEERLGAMVERVHEYEGTVDLLVNPHFAGNGEVRLVERFRHERAEEYREIYHACVRFLRDVLEEVDADDFGFPDVDKLDGELARLKRWREQVEGRDYFGAPGGDRVREILEKCELAFERFANKAQVRESEQVHAPEDVFERLGGTASSSEAVPDDFPL